MSESQGGVCKICRRPPAFSTRGVLYVDHCHDTGRIRGLLCGQCNVGMGAFRDNAELLEIAATYLRTPN